MAMSVKQRIDNLTTLYMEACDKGERKVEIGVTQLRLLLNTYIVAYEDKGYTLDGTNSVTRLRAEKRALEKTVERLREEQGPMRESLNSLTAEKSRWVRQARKAGIKI